MNGTLQSKVAIVTGGASGMGFATVSRFLKEGASVVIGDLNADNGRNAIETLSAEGYEDRVRFTTTDVAVENDVAAMSELALDAFGQLDIVFNNAGIGGAFGPITELDVDDWDTTFHVLVRSVFLGIKHAARIMIDQGRGGSIINTASIAGMGGGGGPQAYSAAKAAVVNLSKTTAIELAPHNIRVNAICPGVIFTPLMHSGNEEQAEEVIAEVQPLAKRGEGSDIAGMALFLAGDDSQFVTGQEHIVDGGLLANGPRLLGRLHNSRNLHRMAGMAFGTSGQAATVRRL
ncbi:MAG: SDR family NAD(P)-dependent oxidoreductase [Actinomycetota bacterium]|uniref:Short-chain dehydrogenase n=1 Tax=marine metagenome TaxID=408172 RepID=A0A381PZH3_9ZZZZ|nr:SDR family oxidoreductase [Acidimicrobiales bacterium]MEC8921129.1 SDR family NAD(P)-dependent oxidoreductase [Actinomycetota bacterium]MED5551684.1 SDR family NAD(P)-dependent oxidoreductase [Actinomycetota bacterium]MEE3140208.1 SDR family NAD(P)-dependent oxidoreductase [Actinomycetota bacterium]MEE3187873.1 SDR family NAD(P)-dependent oxidoreductase [Actinomycetota bacterium]|tara:strand:- start:2329 stop:3195 length:867 start_codon:yes stop_codon:yes gene_type:complete